jgi:hypothetical protein
MPFASRGFKGGMIRERTKERTVREVEYVSRLGAILK